MQTLSYTQATNAVLACFRAKRTALLVGPPGIGKTALIRDVATRVNLPLHTLIGSNCDAVDLAGLPWIRRGELARAMYPEIAACMTAPGILFLDELTTVPPSVQAPLMRLFLERCAGGQALHADSVVVAACNAPEHAPNAAELSAATVNRIIRLHYVPTYDEIRRFFDGADGREESLYRAEARDFSATLACEPGLLHLTPPQVSVDAGTPWGSPRAWEIGLAVLAQHGQDDDVGLALLAGAVGEDSALAYLAIKRLRARLPSVDAIIADPIGAVVPAERTHQIAALGLLSRERDQDVWAAWIYADRLTLEIGAAVARILMSRAPNNRARHVAPGTAAQLRLLAKIRQGGK